MREDLAELVTAELAKRPRAPFASSIVDIYRIFEGMPGVFNIIVAHRYNGRCVTVTEGEDMPEAGEHITRLRIDNRPEPKTN